MAYNQAASTRGARVISIRAETGSNTRLARTITGLLMRDGLDKLAP